MKKHLSAFERGRRIVVAMIAITILLSAATLLFTEDGSTERMVLTLAAFGGLIGSYAAFLPLPALRQTDPGRRHGGHRVPKVQAQPDHR